MRRVNVLPLLAVCTVALVGGCNSSNEGKIEGTAWSSLEMNVAGQHVPADTLQLEFEQDGKLSYATPVGYFTGNYSLGWGDNVTLHLDRELAGQKSHTEKIVINGERMIVTDSDGTSAKFRLVEQK